MEIERNNHVSSQNYVEFDSSQKLEETIQKVVDHCLNQAEKELPTLGTGKATLQKIRNSKAFKVFSSLKQNVKEAKSNLPTLKETQKKVSDTVKKIDTTPIKKAKRKLPTVEQIKGEFEETIEKVGKLFKKEKMTESVQEDVIGEGANSKVRMMKVTGPDGQVSNRVIASTTKGATKAEVKQFKKTLKKFQKDMGERSVKVYDVRLNSAEERELIMEPLAPVTPGEGRPDFGVKMVALFNEMEAKGWRHGDMKIQNVMSRLGSPAMIDLDGVQKEGTLPKKGEDLVNFLDQLEFTAPYDPPSFSSDFNRLFNAIDQQKENPEAVTNGRALADKLLRHKEKCNNAVTLYVYCYGGDFPRKGGGPDLEKMMDRVQGDNNLPKSVQEYMLKNLGEAQNSIMPLSK